MSARPDYEPTLDLVVPTDTYERLRRASRLPCHRLMHGYALARKQDEWMLSVEPVQGWLPAPSSSDVAIYALLDPDTGAVRYIGQSKRRYARFKDHLNDRSQTHRSHWIRSLLARGLLPLFATLEWIPDGVRWAESERAWIAAARSAGCDLVNGTDGGDGVPGLSGDSLRRLRAAWIGRKHSDETKRLIGEKSRDRRHSPEWRTHMREVMTGREFTPEWRAKISARLRKLTPEQAEEIRCLRASGVPRKELAARYGVSDDTIYNVCRGLFYAKSEAAS